MTEIIVLQKWREQHPERVAAPTAKGASAKLLIYTGVRYERREAVDHRSRNLPARAEQN